MHSQTTAWPDSDLVLVLRFYSGCTTANELSDSRATGENQTGHMKISAPQHGCGQNSVPLVYYQDRWSSTPKWSHRFCPMATSAPWNACSMPGDMANSRPRLGSGCDLTGTACKITRWRGFVSSHQQRSALPWVGLSRNVAWHGSKLGTFQLCFICSPKDPKRPPAKVPNFDAQIIFVGINPTLLMVLQFFVRVSPPCDCGRMVQSLGPLSWTARGSVIWFWVQSWDKDTFRFAHSLCELLIFLQKDPRGLRIRAAVSTMPAGNLVGHRRLR